MIKENYSKWMAMLKKTGNKLIIVSIILFIIAIKLWIEDSHSNGINTLVDRVIGISFFITALVAFMSGKGINSSEVKRIEKEKQEKKKAKQERANMRKEIKQEILNELKNGKNQTNL